MLGALSARQRTRFDQLLSSLSEPELNELLAPEGRLAVERPLLHLMAGGRSRMALFALATTTAAADELLGLLANPDEFAEVLATTNAVIGRAALEWVGHAQRMLEEEQDVDVPFCEALDQVGATLEDVQLRYAARQLWLTLEASPAARLNLARAAIWNAAWSVAREQYQTVAREPAQSPEIKQFSEQIRHLLEASAELSRAPKNADEATAHARVQLGLRNPGAAAKVLDRYAEQAPSHLGLATVRLLAAFPDTPCAGVRAGLGNLPLCAFAQREGMFKSPLFQDLRRAWESKNGRTTRSVQDFLGLGLVLPWRAGSLLDASAMNPEPAAELRAFSEEVSTLAPEFAALSVFARALEVGFRAAKASPPGLAPRIDVADADALVQAALGLAAQGFDGDTPGKDMRVAAVLGIAALLSQHRDMRPLYSQLKAQTARGSLVSQVALGAWLAAAWQDAPLFERVKAEAIDALQQAPQTSVETSDLVLLLAEAANVVEPNTDNSQTLAQLALGLLEPGVPAALRLRAALHRAHLLEAGGKPEQVEHVLREVLEASAPRAPDTPLAGVLRLLTEARLVLRALPATDPKLALERFRSIFQKQPSPPSVVAWQRLWELELGYRASLGACGKNAQCKRGAELTRKRAQAEVRGTIPPVTARLSERGVLTLGALELTLDYHPGIGLVSVVRTDPALVFLPWPQP